MINQSTAKDPLLLGTCARFGKATQGVLGTDSRLAPLDYDFLYSMQCALSMRSLL